jgi:small subunit ribosomal protein S5
MNETNTTTQSAPQAKAPQRPMGGGNGPYRGGGRPPFGGGRGGPGGPGGRGGPGGPRRDGRGGPRRNEGERSEFIQKNIEVRRVSRTVAGGRRFAFSCTMVIGDKKGRVGVGIGKAMDTQAAVQKAVRAAQKNLITLNLTPSKSLPKNLEGKHAASYVEMRPAKGRGLVAGSSVRAVLELAGVTDVTAKLLSGSKNKINNARAAIEALKAIAK